MSPSRRISSKATSQIASIRISTTYTGIRMTDPIQMALSADKNSLYRTRSPVTIPQSDVGRLLDMSKQSNDYFVSFRGPHGAVGTRDIYTHHLHWYPAKMFYRIPAAILDALKLPPGSTILDPFCGSGTVLVEALSRGYSAIGVDLHPIARLISRTKTTPLDRIILQSYLVAILDRARRLRRSPPPSRLPHFWFRRPARDALFRLYHAIDNLVGERSYRDFFFANLTNITRRCSLADPAIPSPSRMRPERCEQAGPRYQRALQDARSLNTTEIYRRYETATARNVERLCTFLPPHRSCASVVRGSALSLDLPDSQIDAIITSPPYCGAQKYVRTFKLELLLMGYSSDQIRRLEHASLGTERGFPTVSADTLNVTPQRRRIIADIRENNPRRARMLESYLFGLSEFASEVHRVLRPSGDAFISFGTSRFAGFDVDLADCFSESCPVGLRLVAKLTDRIPSRGLITRRHPSSAVISTEHVLWLRKE